MESGNCAILLAKPERMTKLIKLSYEKKLKYIIKKNLSNNNIVLHSNLLTLDRKFLLDKKKIKSIILLNLNKAIFLPAFNFNKRKKLNFDKNEDSFGALTNLFINDKKFKRIINPIHSYIYKNHRIIKNFKTFSFGKKSIFQYFYDSDFTWVNFGCEYNQGYTLFHHAEELNNVSYRKKITFKKVIQYKKKNIKINYNYFARKKKVAFNFKKAVLEMRRKRIIKFIKFENTFLEIGKVKKIINFLNKKLKLNKNYLLY